MHIVSTFGYLYNVHKDEREKLLQIKLKKLTMIICFFAEIVTFA